MKQKGISLEMRLISTKTGYDKVPHDRFIIAENVKYNLPSFTTITKGRFSEIKTTTNDIPFEDYWNHTDSLDILIDWPKIKDVLDKIVKRMYGAVCSRCNKEIEVSFKPDGVRPVYFTDCLRKLNRDNYLNNHKVLYR